MFFGVGHVGRQGIRGRSAVAGPTLALDFMTPGSLDPRITFTRASSGTYFDSAGVMQTAATNAPRWDYDPSTLQLKGLLIEEARTNLWLQSANASNAAWLKLNVTVALPVVTGNQSVAPDGNMTAARVVYPSVPSGPNVSVLSESFTTTAAVYTFSVWLKGSVGGEIIYLSTTSDSVSFSRQQCVLTTEWRRFTITPPTLTVTTWGFSIGNDGRNGGPAISAATVFVWGAQVELGAFATSHIPTTSAAVTRNADQCQVAAIGAASWFNATTGTLGFEYAAPRSSVVGGTSDGTTANQIIFNQIGTVPVVVATVAKTLTPAPVLTYPAVNKAIMSYQSNRAAACLNGGTVVSDATIPAGPFLWTTRLSIGSSPHALDAQINGYMQRVRFWDRTLTDTELQSVTTL